VGLETLLPLSLKLVDDKILSLPKMVEKLTSRPREIFNLDRGTLKTGSPADVVIFNPKAEIVIDASRFKSKSKNTPFDGWKGRGEVVYTLVAGKIVYSHTH